MVRPGTAVLLALLLLPGCGQLPRPFAPEGKDGNGLLHLKDRAGIMVLPTSGDVPGAPEAAARAMANALRALNIPASVKRGNRESQILHSRALVLPLADGRDEVLLYWELRAPDGARAGRYAQRRALPRGTWEAGVSGVIDRLVAAAAPAIAAMAQDPVVEPAGLPGFPAARLVVLPLDIAPGDGAASLPRALEAALRAAKLPIADKIAADDLLLVGNVALGPPENGLQDVAVTWLVVSARDNQNLGEIAQRTRVPEGSLDGPWGATARAIARGAAAGVIDLLARVGRP